MSRTPEIASLDEVKYLYLRESSEPRDNSLRLVVEEAVSNRTAAPAIGRAELPELGAILNSTWPIEPIEGCRTFELYWSSYVAYLVAEEMAGSCGNYGEETYTGKVLRIYSKSYFLDFMARYTGAHPKPIQHYKLTCLNHLIDVASYEPPEIRIIGRVSRPAAPIH
jgi:hypothetical protein